MRYRQLIVNHKTPKNIQKEIIEDLDNPGNYYLQIIETKRLKVNNAWLDKWGLSHIYKK